MNCDAIVKSYFRSVQRGTRTMEQVPEELREAVTALYDAWMGEAKQGA